MTTARRQGPGKARPGFTLIEIMMVVVIIGMMATAVLPRLSFYTEPPLTLLQRAVDEAGNKALTGVSIRFVLKPEENSRRGAVGVEALVKEEVDPHDLSHFLGTADPDAEVLKWVPTKLSYALEGKGWLMEPEIVYFFTDGSCTPARISWAGEGVPERDAEQFFLTVTGYCTTISSSR